MMVLTWLVVLAVFFEMIVVMMVEYWVIYPQKLTRISLMVRFLVLVATEMVVGEMF